MKKMLFLLILVSLCLPVFSQKNQIGWAEGLSYRRAIMDRFWVGYSIFPKYTGRDEYQSHDIKQGLHFSYQFKEIKRLQINFANEIYFDYVATKTDANDEKSYVKSFYLDEIPGFILRFKVIDNLFIEKMFGIKFTWERKWENIVNDWSDPIDTYRIDAIGDNINWLSSFRIFVTF